MNQKPLIVVSLFLFMQTLCISQGTLEFHQKFRLADSLYVAMQLDSSLVYAEDLIRQIETRNGLDIEEDVIHRTYFMRGRALSLTRQYAESNQNWHDYLNVLSRDFPLKKDKAIQIHLAIATNFYFWKKPTEMKSKLEGVKPILDTCRTCSFSTLALFENLSGQLQYFTEDLMTGISHLDQALCLYRLAPDTNSVKMISCVSEMSNFYAAMGQTSQAVKMSLYAQEKASQAFGPNSFKARKYSNNIGLDYYQLQHYSKAAFYLEDYVAAVKDQYGENHVDLAPAYINLGLLYDLSNTNKSLQYFQAAERLYIEAYGPDFTKLTVTYINLATLHGYLRQMNEAYHYLDLLEKLSLKSYGQEGRYYIVAKRLRGEFLIDDEKYSEALNIFDEVNAEYNLNPPPNPLRVLENMASIGRCLFYLGEYDSAQIQLLRSEEFAKKIIQPTRVIQADIASMLALIELEKSKFVGAIDLNEKALRLIYASTENDKIIQVNKLSSLFKFLSQRLKIEYEYCQRDKLRDTEELNRLIDYTIEALHQGVNRMADQDEKHRFRRRFRSLTNQLLFYLTEMQANEPLLDVASKALKLMELNKNTNLLVDMKLEDYFADDKSIDQLIYKEQELRLKLKNIRLKIESNHIENSVESALISVLKDSLFIYNERYAEVMKQMKEDHAAYYEIFHIDKIVGVSEIQSKVLSRNDAMVQYFLEDTLLYSLTIMHDTAFVNRVVFNEDLKRDVSSWLSVLNKPGTKSMDERGQDFCSLFLSDRITASTALSNLLIVHDGLTHFIPFEVLQTTDRGQITYLNESKIISYHNSVSLALNYKNQNKKALKHYGFAASDSGDESDSQTQPLIALRSGESFVNRLPAAIEEVESIAKLLPSRVFLDEDATETRFKSECQNMDIIHLSLHGILSDSMPFESGLLFNQEDTLNDGVLKVSEIYGLNLESELAVLSACETGLGKIKSGDGLQSISRAFTYAGVQSTVMSLWKVPDKQTKQIMVGFYQGLKNGLRKDEALQQAKLKYLAETSEPLARHPYYWAGFVIQGNTAPIEFSDTAYWIYGVFLILLMYIILIVKRVRK